MEQEPSKNQEKEEKKSEVKEPLLKCLKRRIFPTKQQASKLKKWMGTVRWTYNQAVDAIRTKKAKGKLQDLRNLLVTNNAIESFKSHEEWKKKDYCQWVKDTPMDLRDDAIRDLVKAIDSTSKLCKKKNQKFSYQQFSFRSRKKTQRSDCDTITIRGRDWGRKRGVYSDVFGKDVLKTERRTKLPEKIEYSFRIQLDWLNRFWILLPTPLDIRSDNQAPKSNRVVAIDPGLRTFATCYDPSGTVSEFGTGDRNRLSKLHRLIDKCRKKLGNKEKTLRAKKRWRLKRRCKRISQRLFNLVEEAHKKICLWLCQNHRVILLPKFNVSDMTKKEKQKRDGTIRVRCLSKLTTRQMLAWCHFRFRQRLLFKSQEFPWCKVIICDEYNTTRTCGCCGKLNYSVGKSETFQCNSCSYVGGRDINAARNILLRFLSEKRRIFKA